MVVYATPNDLEQWVGESIPGAEALLREASLVVDSLLIGAVYDTDEDGKPTDSYVKDTLRDATCAQAAWVGETGGSEGPSSFGTLRFDAPAPQGHPHVTDSVVLILAVSGLLNHSPRLAR